MGRQLILLFTGVLCTAFNYCYAQVPVINSFSPAKGFTGTQVTISGNGFNPLANGNIVYFGATRARVISAGISTLVVEVPAGATLQPISVLNTTNHLTGFSSNPFHTTFLSKGFFTSVDFDGRVDFDTGDSPGCVAIGDLDGDGKADMVVANRGSNSISVYQNIALSGVINTASFASRFDIPTNTAPSYLDLGDIDGDGKLDIVVANNANISIFRNQSVVNTLSESSFAPRVDLLASGTPFTLKIGDLDIDGKPDIAVSYISTRINDAAVSVFRNTSVMGGITFSPKADVLLGTGYFSVNIAAVSNNGKPALLVTDANKSSVFVFKNMAVPGSLTPASFEPPVGFTTGVNPVVINTGDIDGDNKPDLVLSNFGNLAGPLASGSFFISVLLNNTSGNDITTSSFSPTNNFSTGRAPQSSTIGDLDGDGKLDVVNSNSQSNDIYLHHNVSTIGNASFANRINLPAQQNPQNIKIADIDGDGKPDIIFVNALSNTVSVYRNNSTVLQSINFPPLSPVVYGTPDFALNAISTYPDSPVIYTSNNTAVATITPAGLIHTTGAGTTVITASQVDNVSISPALPVSRTLTVTPASLMLKADDKKRDYQASNPAFTITYTGFVNGDGPANLNTTYTATAAAGVNSLPGSYIIAIPRIGSSSNYNITYADGLLTINKLSQTIQFDALADKTIGDAGFTLSATASSGLPVTFTSNDAALATVTGNNVNMVKAGTVYITATQAGNDIYEPISVTQPLIIMGAPFVVITNLITPNGDGINDTWKIDGLNNNVPGSVNIFNRNGEIVFRSVGYPTPFNGTRNGKRLPAGVYYYVINFTAERKKLSGSLTIIY